MDLFSCAFLQHIYLGALIAQLLSLLKSVRLSYPFLGPRLSCPTIFSSSAFCRQRSSFLATDPVLDHVQSNVPVMIKYQSHGQVFVGLKLNIVGSTEGRSSSLSVYCSAMESLDVGDMPRVVGFYQLFFSVSSLLNTFVIR